MIGPQEVKLLKRPRIHLVDAAIPTGGLGPMPKASAPQRRVGSYGCPSFGCNQARCRKSTGLLIHMPG